MGAAAGWLATQDWADLGAHELALTERLLGGLGAMPGVRVCSGPTGLQQRLGVVAFEVDGIHAHDVCQMLDGFGVCLRGGHHCAQPLMDALRSRRHGRASIAPYNDAADIDALLNGLEATIRKLR